MLNSVELTVVISINHQSTTNNRLKPVMTTGLVNTHIDRSIANLAFQSVIGLKHLLSSDYLSSSGA